MKLAIESYQNAAQLATLSCTNEQQFAVKRTTEKRVPCIFLCNWKLIGSESGDWTKLGTMGGCTKLEKWLDLDGLNGEIKKTFDVYKNIIISYLQIYFYLDITCHERANFLLLRFE